MGNKYKYGYIIPVHKKDDRVFRAINSILSFENTLLCISTNEEISKWIEEKKGYVDFSNVCQFFSHDTSYQSLVNGGIEVLKGHVELISICEYDDVVTSMAHDIMDEYSEDYPNIEIYMPLACMVTESDESDEENKKLNMIGMLNEAPFAPGLADEYGKLDFNMVLRANFAFINGCYFKPPVFENYGVFKKNIEIMYDYEYIIRAIYGGVDVMSIPKVCRFHYFSPDGEFERQKSLPEKEREFWLIQARKEYMFDEDREISR